MPIFNQTELGILRALSYADVFDFPLTFEETYSYFIGSDPTERPLIKEALALLIEKEKVIESGGFYTLPGRESLVSIRLRRLGASRKNWEKARRLSLIFRMLPWVHLLGVSGSLAMANSDEEDDIDLLFITASKRVWLTRLVVVIFLKLIGKYRSRSSIRGRFCTNLFISESALGNFSQNLFIAHEIVQMRPLWNTGETYISFLLANPWIYRHLPNTKRPPLLPVKKVEPTFISNLLYLLESLARRYQLRLMEKKKTVEVTTDSIISLHPRDTKNSVLEAYEQRLHSLLSPNTPVL